MNYGPATRCGTGLPTTALSRAGATTVWISPEAVAGWRAPSGRRTFTDAAIAAALPVRAVYRLALRQAEGLIRPVFALLGLALPVPDHTTLSRRGRATRVEQCAAADGCGLDLAIDSTGLCLAKPPGAGHEGWRKLHIAVDPDTGRILAEELTRSDVHDTVPVPTMLARITGRLRRVYGDAAYAGGPTYRAVVEHRQTLPNVGGVFRPKAPDIRSAAQLDPLTGRGRHARQVARDGRRAQPHGRTRDAEDAAGRLNDGSDGSARPHVRSCTKTPERLDARWLITEATTALPLFERRSKAKGNCL